MKKKFLLPILIILPTVKLLAQPFVDIASFNYQTFSSTYKDSTKWKNKTEDYFLNFFLPKEFKNGNTLLIRLNTEMINSSIGPDSSYSYKLYGLSLPLGFQFVSEDKKWKTMVMVIPKIGSDLNDAVNKYDYQYGGVFLENYIPNERLKIKAGLYYNREAFGNFFVPLVGIDWKVTERINLYGVLPTNYKVEFNLIKGKLYTGLNFKSLTRSFRLSQKNNYDYVRYDEMQLKLFADWFVYKKFLLFMEAGYTLGRNPLQYKYNTKDETYANPLYTPLKNYPIVNIGLAYRIRLDLEKKE